MPPKRKRKALDASPEKEAKKETKEEKKERIELQKLRAKKWAAERRIRAAAKGQTVTSSAVEQSKTARGGRKNYTAASPKKKPATTLKSTTRKSRRAKERGGQVQDQEKDEEIVKRSIKRRRISKPADNESDPVHVESEPLQEPKVSTENTPKTQPKPTNGAGAAAYEAPTPAQHFMSPNEKVILAAENFMSPEVLAAAQNSGLSLVYIPVNLATASTSQIPVPSIADFNSKSAPIPPLKTLEPASAPATAPDQEEKQAQQVKSVEMAQKSIVQVVEEEEGEEKLEMDAKENSNVFPSSTLSIFLRNFVKFTVFAAVGSFILIHVASLIFDGNESPTKTLFSNGKASFTSHNTTPCFYNHGFGGENEEMDITCDEPLDCPEYARCEGGKVVDCLEEDISWSGGFYVPSEKGDQCVVSPSALEGMMNLHSALTELTIEYVCRSSIGFGPVCRVPPKDLLEKESIFFEVTSVASIAELTVDQLDTLLEKMKSNDIVEQTELKENELVGYIGMSEDYVNKNLPISSYCWLRIVAWDLVRVVAAFLYGILLLILNSVWTIAVANPLPALVVGVITYGFLWIRNKRSRVSRLRKEASEIQNLAYNKLVMDCNEGEGYASLHLRDEIAHELHPEPCPARQRFNSLVWLRVAALIRADNRVTKTRKSIGGKSLEWFEWASDSSRKSRRSLAANSSVATNGEDIAQKTKSE